ncbi:MAG TPA: nucleotidyl transferase AbiEii/AbiGii toxin family protein [Ferrovaceae bacterium]|nr:nucleotidyl transferase AbiEii/AbiGii toxin family protein [Ferrovaceae bacterium]
MIDKLEIADLARELSLDLHVVEKDYVLGWLLAGIAANTELSGNWIFKGGTCLKKCYFETYRFSEDLDFTVTNESQLDVEYLLRVFAQMTEWIYEQSGIEIPRDQIRFKLSLLEGGRYVEGRIYYIGPLMQKRNLARIKFDLTSKEKLVLSPQKRVVHHPYSDCPQEGISVLSYCFEEVFAEKMRALAERERPRDLYDVVHLYRHNQVQPDRHVILKTLQEKCAFKGIPVPTIASLQRQDAKTKLAVEWEDMLAHQLPVLPDLEQFWNEIPTIFRWLYGDAEKPVLGSVPIDGLLDNTWQPPAMVHAWRAAIPMESVRFAAANQLCVNLRYQNTWRLIEPYSLRRSKEGNLLLCAVKHIGGESRTYRVDRIQDVEVSTTPFNPRYQIELTPTRLLTTL